MESRFLYLKSSSKIILLILPVLVCVAIVAEILAEDIAKLIVFPILVLILILTATSALNVIFSHRTSQNHS